MLAFLSSSSSKNSLFSVGLFIYSFIFINTLVGAGAPEHQYFRALNLVDWILDPV